MPRNARWYTPQSEIATCPLCEEVLQWKRDAEPAQLSASFQGIAMGMTWALWFTIPKPLVRWVMEHLGTWFVVLIPMLLIAMLLIAVRPSLLGTGQGIGHFVTMQPPAVKKPKFWVSLIIVVAITVSVRTAPQTAQFPLWGAWLALAAAGCLAAVLWRRSAERHKRLHTPDSAASPATRLS
ncbi:MAG: hypothetical protein ACK41V_19815 [Acidovorax sp.]|uniref:hypothetical protein n=1 Tax=Acidovorax sp. TaxID=1872122 RepID=UPI00391D7771